MPLSRSDQYAGPGSYKPFQKFLTQDWGGGPSLVDIAKNFKFQRINNNKANTANYLLATIPGKSSSSFSGETVTGGAESEEPGFISQLFDYASIPMHTAWNVVENNLAVDTDFSEGNLFKNILEEVAYDTKENIKDVALGQAAIISRAPEGALGNVLFAPQNIAEGIVNKVTGGNMEEWVNKRAPRTRGSQILEKYTDIENPWIREGLGFGLDVAVDPLTYVGGIGLARKAKSGVELGTRLAEEATAAAPRVIHTPEKILEARAAGTYDLPTAGMAPEGTLQGDIARLIDPRASQFGRQQTQRGVARAISTPRPLAEEAVTGLAPLSRSRELANLYPENLRSRLVEIPEPKPVRMPFEEFVTSKKIGLDYTKTRIPRPPEQVARQVDTMRVGRALKRGEAFDPRIRTFSQSDVIKTFKDVLEGRVAPHVIPFAKATGDEAEEAISIAKQVGKMHGDDISPVVQQNMFNKIWKETEKLAVDKGYKSLNSRGAVKWRMGKAVSMLRSAEDALIAAGHTPQHSTNIGMRLSDVLADLPKLPATQKELDEVLASWGVSNAKMIPRADVRRAVNTALARRQVTSVDFVSNLSRYATQAKSKIDSVGLDPIERRRQLDNIRKAAEKSAIDSGATVKEAKQFVKLVEQNADLPKTTVDSRIFTPEHSRNVVYGKVDQNTIKKVDEAVYNDRFGIPPKSPRLRDRFGAHRGVPDSFMERIATWYGKGGMQRYALDAYLTGEANAIAKADAANSLLKNYSDDELLEAFRILQEKIPPNAASTERVGAAAMEMNKWVSEIVGSHTFRKAVGGVVKPGQDGALQRMNALMGDVNHELNRMGFKSIREFRFTNKKIKDAKTGIERDFTPDGETWVNSWKAWDITEDPVTFVYNLDLALERVGKRYAFMEDAAARFSRRLKSDEWVHKFDEKKYPVLAGRYFREIEYNQLKKTLDDLEKGPWKPQNKMTRYYATGLSAWKAGVTIYSPAHHIRNLIGDLWFTWAAGINDPRTFQKAARVMNASKRYKEARKTGDFETLRDLLNPDFVRYEADKSSIITKLNGQAISADDYYMAAFQRGLLRDVNAIEEIALDTMPGTKSLTEKVRPLGGRARAVATKTAQGREHYVRLQHFIGHVEKRLRAGDTDIAKIYDEAAHQVRKWHPDGSELTRMEQGARLVFPFYSWTRKAIPLVVQSMLHSPAKVMAYPRLQYATQSAMGIQQDEEGLLDPFPDDALFPSWSRASGIGPIGDAREGGLSGFIGKTADTTKNILGEETGYAIANPGNPFNDVITQFTGLGRYNDPLMGALEMLTPAAKIPFEVSQGAEITGVPLEGRASEYIVKNIPIGSLAAGMFPQPFLNEEKAERQGTVNEQAVINWLTAMRLAGQSPFRKTAEFEARERARGY